MVKIKLWNIVLEASSHLDGRTKVFVKQNSGAGVILLEDLTSDEAADLVTLFNRINRRLQREKAEELG